MYKRQALRILLLLLSMLGFLALLAEKFGVRIEFAPAVVCAGFSSVLLLAGYFNLLPFAAGALWPTGIALLLLFGKKAFFHRRRNCAVVLCLLYTSLSPLSAKTQFRWIR